jgi:hypothetical protein
MTPRPALIAAALLALHAAAGAACYTLLDPAGRVVLQSTTAPVRLSDPAADTVQQRWPGHHLVVSRAAPCAEIAPPRLQTVPFDGDGRAPIESPLLALAEPMPSYEGTDYTVGPRRDDLHRHRHHGREQRVLIVRGGEVVRVVRVVRVRGRR